MLGESGSGKTTLLNILSGMIPFDCGTVSVDGTENSTIVPVDSYASGYDYITQDAFFVDYLSVKENLKIISSDEKKIRELLVSFGLIDIIDNLPSSLSGGEKQRLALARTLLTSKSVIFLDEPTASLDKENKVKIFEILQEMSKTKLIICSSHDSEAKLYADEVICFEKPSYTEAYGEILDNKHPQYHKNKGGDITYYRLKDKKLYQYISKWFSSQKRGQKLDIVLFVFLTIAMCMCMLADTPTAKLYSNMEYVYKVNSLRVSTKNNSSNSYYISLEGNEGVNDVVLVYGGSIPRQSSIIEGEMSINHDLLLYAIPFEKDTFQLSDRLVAGTYFQNENDIILSYEMAEQVSGGDFNSIIGQTMEINPYAKGKTTVRIVGVFDKFNDFEAQYLKSCGIPYDAGDSYNPDNYRNLFFLNSLFMDDYLNDPNCSNGGQRIYQLYFDSFDNMLNYYEDFDESQGHIYMEPLSANVEDSFILLSVVLLPLAVLTMLLSILFYANLIGTELTYNNRFISVFHYAGYRIKDVVACFIKCCMLRVFVICSVAAMASAIITTIFNFINYKFIIIGFQVFTYNIWLIFAFVVIMCFSSIISIQLFMRRVKTRSWYENLVSTRDLL